MRRRNREINIFNMSALDLFASALGAFILLFAILMPYYLKTSKIVMQENVQLKAQVKEQQLRLQALEQENADYKARLSQTFLAVVMKWPTAGVDIDLYVKDTAGNVFSFEQQTHSGTLAELSVDTKIGPGIEIWEHPSASPGEYVVSYDFFKESPVSEPTEITGTVYFRDGAKKLQSLQLNGRGDNKQVAIITVTPEGDVSVR